MGMSYERCLPIGGVLWDVPCYIKKAKLRLVSLVRKFCIFTVFLLNLSSADRIRFSFPPRNARRVRQSTWLHESLGGRNRLTGDLTKTLYTLLYEVTRGIQFSQTGHPSFKNP